MRRYYRTADGAAADKVDPEQIKIQACYPILMFFSDKILM